MAGSMRHAELLASLGNRYAILRDGLIFLRYGNMVVPFGPVAHDYTISKSEARQLLKQLGGVLVRWTSGFTDRELPWYAVICDQFRGLASLKAKNRSEINRGLNNCSVRRIEAEHLARDGYPVFEQAFRRYGIDPPPQDYFSRRVSASVGFEDVMQHWAVFHKERMIAFASNLVFGDVEADYSTIKFHPDYLSLYPSYALIHTMNEYYLRGRVGYVNGGFRSLLHETNIQQHLIQKFGFRKASVGMGLVYRQPFGALLKLASPLRSIVGGLDPRIAAIYELDRAAKARTSSLPDTSCPPPLASR